MGVVFMYFYLIVDSWLKCVAFVRRRILRSFDAFLLCITNQELSEKSFERERINL